jgi:N-acetylglutamate synthase-like GNAT family acetyltransferase
MNNIRFRPANEADRPALRAFLLGITLLGDDLISANSAYWLLEDQHIIIGSTGLEFGAHAALMRSVAVLPEKRDRGWGQQLMWYALHQAQQRQYRYCYCFSVRAGAYWQRFGFENVSTSELAEQLADTPQVQRFAAIGKLANEVAWRFDLQQAITAERYPDLAQLM